MGEEERELCLVEQWVRLTEERNAVLAPSENSGVPGAPTQLDLVPVPGMELHTPVLFLNLDNDDLSNDSPCVDEDHLPLVGANSILPKEHGARFVQLPILREPTRSPSTRTRSSSWLSPSCQVLCTSSRQLCAPPRKWKSLKSLELEQI